MKKAVLLITLFSFSFAQAQYTDDIESYDLGPLFQAHWSNWSDDSTATGEHAIVTDYRASSGTKSVLISDGTAQDAVLDLGNQTSGSWSVSFKLYLPTDSTGYYNFQETLPITTGVWALNIFFFGDSAGTGGVYDDTGNPLVGFSYPIASWFDMSHEINLDTDSINMKIDGTTIYDGPFYGSGNLGGIDFYSIDTLHNLYIDDVVFALGDTTIVETVEIAEYGVYLYPNPNNGEFVLSLYNDNESRSIIEITNTLGQVVSSDIVNLRPGNQKYSIDLSGIDGGIYFVRVGSITKRFAVK